MRNKLGIVVLSLVLGGGYSSTLFAQPGEGSAQSTTLSGDDDGRVNERANWGWLGLLGLTGLMGLKRRESHDRHDRPVVRHDTTQPSPTR